LRVVPRLSARSFIPANAMKNNRANGATSIQFSIESSFYLGIFPVNREHINILAERYRKDPKTHVIVNSQFHCLLFSRWMHDNSRCNVFKIPRVKIDT